MKRYEILRVSYVPKKGEEWLIVPLEEVVETDICGKKEAIRRASYYTEMQQADYELGGCNYPKKYQYIYRELL